MFLERVYEGKNEIGRWIGMAIILILVSQFIGGLPLGLLISMKLAENPDLQPNPENLLDLSAYEISPITGLVLMLIPFVLGLITLLLLIKPIHERPMLSVITGSDKFRWQKFFWGGGVWLLLLSGYSIVVTATGLQKIELQFDPAALLMLAFVTILLIPLQAGFEEVLFRGYLMQGLAKTFKYKWIPLIITSLIFGGLHFFNPEVKEYGAAVALPQYIWSGLFFGICVLLDEGLEMAWGVHAINNIFLSLLFTQDSSALQTPALFRITAFNPLIDLIALIALSVIFLLLARKKYLWPGWGNLFTKIEEPGFSEEEIMDYLLSEYDEDYK